MKVLILIIVFFAGSGMAGIYETHDSSNVYRKRLILSELENESLERCALILAIASIETESFKVDYPEGDRKTGGAYNVSIYKMNLAMIAEIDSSAPAWSIHKSIPYATFFINKSIDILGVVEFLRMHRGGVGWKTLPRGQIDSYLDAVIILQKEYLKRPWELDVKTTTDLRLTVKVEAI